MGYTEDRQISSREHLSFVYIVRAFAIMAVVMVHATSYSVGEYSTGSPMFILYNLLNTFNRFGTTTFIFLSAFVLFYSYYERPLNKTMIVNFYKKRALYIIVPYVICSIFYYMIGGYYSYGQSWNALVENSSLSDFFDLLIMGKTFYHLYFIFISIQFYLLFPLLIWLLQRKPGLVKHIVWGGFVLQWVFVLYNFYVLQYPDKSYLAISYLSYFTLGAYCGIHYDKIKQWLFKKKQPVVATYTWLPLWILWLAAGLSHVYLWYQTRANLMSVHAMVYEILWFSHTYLTVFVLMQMAYVLWRKLHPRLVNVLIHLGMVSFGIYIIHAAVVFFYDFYIPKSGIAIMYHVRLAVGYVVSLTFPWIVTGLMKQYWKQSWIFFGSMPKKNPYREVPASRADTARSYKVTNVS